MSLVDLSRRAQVSHVECVEVVVFGSAEQDGRLQRVEYELVHAHLCTAACSQSALPDPLISRGIVATFEQGRKGVLTCMATRPSAFPLRRSYKHTVRSLPLLASTLVSLLLKATQTMCSPDDEVDVEWNLRVESGAVLVSSQISMLEEPVAKMGS